MGLFDSLYLSCQDLDCHGQVEFQSKWGDHCYATYSLNDCPELMQEDLDGKTEFCDICGEPIRLELKTVTETKLCIVENVYLDH